MTYGLCTVPDFGAVYLTRILDPVKIYRGEEPYLLGRSGLWRRQGSLYGTVLN